MGFRGASSLFGVGPGYKRSFNVSIDAADGKQRLLGYKSLNLLNSHSDPSFLHSVLVSHVARQYVPGAEGQPRARRHQRRELGRLRERAAVRPRSWCRRTSRSPKAARAGRSPEARSGRGGLEYFGADLEEYKRRFELKSGDGGEGLEGPRQPLQGSERDAARRARGQARSDPRRRRRSAVPRGRRRRRERRRLLDARRATTRCSRTRAAGSISASRHERRRSEAAEGRRRSVRAAAGGAAAGRPAPESAPGRDGAASSDGTARRHGSARRTDARSARRPRRQEEAAAQQAARGPGVARALPRAT